MLYDYRCENCECFLEDVQQSMKDDPLTECPECHELKLVRCITGGIGVICQGDAKTLKQQADRNTKKMGHYELQDRENADKLRTLEAKQHLNQINAMNKEQQQKYIEHGTISSNRPTKP